MLSYHVVSDTGPLISALQSDSLGVLQSLFGKVHTTAACRSEAVAHGWGEALSAAGRVVVSHRLTGGEVRSASGLAQQVALRPCTRHRQPESHLGEAEAMVLACRAAFGGAMFLADELAARAIAERIGLRVSGFPGVLLAAARRSLLTPEDLRGRLERCRECGTHYAASLIDQVYRAAMEGL